jgi:hypothetical protein
MAISQITQIKSTTYNKKRSPTCGWTWSTALWGHVVAELRAALRQSLKEETAKREYRTPGKHPEFDAETPSASST